MNEEEKLILEKFGKDTPFKVPEGFFDDFTKDLMAKLPEWQEDAFKKKRSAAIIRRMSVIITSAAVFIGVCILAVSYLLQKPEQPVVAKQAKDNHIENINNTYNSIDEAAEYTMLDNEDIYAYVSER
jgi:anti-sigma-K factor RskA